MKQLATCALFVLLFDTALGWIYWTALLLLRCPSCTGLVGLWSFGAAKWMCLYYLTSVLTDGKSDPVLRRLVYLLCLLCPVIETGRMLMSQTDPPYMGPSPDLTRVPLSTLISLLACLIWEKGLGDETGQIERARQLLKRLVKFFKDDVFYLRAAFSALIVVVICDMLILSYQGAVIDMLSASMVQTSFHFAILKLVPVSIGSAMFSGVRGGLFMFILARLNRRLKHLLFHSLLQQEIQFFDKNDSGELSKRLHSDVNRIGRTVALNANAFVRGTFKSCLMLVMMVQLSWQLTVITFLEMLLLASVEHKRIIVSGEMKNQIQTHKAQISALVLQTVSGIETVRSFNAEYVEFKRYNEVVQQLSAVKRQYGIYSPTFGLLKRMVSLVMRIMFFVLARRLILSNQLRIEILVTFVFYQVQMSYNLKEIMYGYGDTLSTVGVISKVFSYLDRKPKCKTAGHLAPEKLEGRIVFENVSFAYPSASAKKTAPLKSVSMELLPGKMTALVGPSGSGKSTCVSLLKRLYEPQEGQILLDGRPLHEYDLKYLHKKMALVSQNPELFRGSVNYNIEYGLKESNMEKVQETAKRINAESFFSDLVKGYDTDVGELPEGLKQSVAILRALVRDPQVIILDEATSKLDVIAQDAVLEEIRSRGRTVLVVAHQLKTVEDAHQIIFLENGEIVEKGTHQELMDKKGRYYSLREELFKT